MKSALEFRGWTQDGAEQLQRARGSEGPGRVLEPSSPPGHVTKPHEKILLLPLLPLAP